MKLHTICLLSVVLASVTARAYEPSWDGNHPAAQSEAWTWMGHLNEIETVDGVPRLGARGLGYIFYYTRSVEKTMGTMTFRSSALTTTQNGVGTAFKTDTLYASKYKDGALRVREGSLDLSFTADGVSDRAATAPFTPADRDQLIAALKFFPTLRVTPGFSPKKTSYREVERDGTVVDLTYYSIWPVLSAPGGQIRFLGQDGTYTYTEPMLVTVGTVGGKAVAGLSFLDRQWAMNSFGEYVMDGLTDLLRSGHAFKYAHNWSAFHAQNQRTGEWSFFHLWHQWSRADAARDRLDDYSGMLYIRNNGTEAALVDAKDYAWRASGFVLQKGREIVMDFTKGRDGFFTSRADVEAPGLGLKLSMFATPALQNLNQPIPFFEGFASGEGSWAGDRLAIKGRLESSRIMFRDEDYREMLDTLKIQAEVDPAWAQADVAAYLVQKLADGARPQASSLNPFVWLEQRFNVVSSLMGGMGVKLAIVRAILSGKKAAVDARDPAVMTYY